MITSQVSYCVPPRDSSVSLSLGVFFGPQRCRLARHLALLARSLCPLLWCLELGEGVGFAAAGSLRPPCQEASGGRPRPNPVSITPPSPTPAFLATIGRGQVALALRVGAAGRERSPKCPEALDCAADQCIREECVSVRVSPIGAGSWGHVEALLVSCQILNPGAEEFTALTSEIF